MASRSGYTVTVLARRLDEVLAQTDPFDLAQAAERYVHTLSAPEICRLIDAAKPRLNEYYAEEFSRVQAIDDGDSLRAAFAHALGANLRVIPLLGTSFAEAILEHAPSERAVGFSDERAIRTPRIIAGGVVALSLAAVAVAGGHYVTTTRSQSSAAVAAGAPPPVTVALPSPSQAIQRRSTAARGAHRTITAKPQHPVANAAPPKAPAVYAAPAPIVQTPGYAPVAAHHAVAAAAPRAKNVAAVPVAHGEAVVQVTAPPRRPAVQPESSPATLDTTDMPQPYTDATPLPDETPVPATDVPRVVHVANPTPAPRHGGWLHRTIMHLDPFKPHPAPTP